MGRRRDLGTERLETEGLETERLERREFGDGATERKEMEDGSLKMEEGKRGTPAWTAVRGKWVYHSLKKKG